MSMFPTHVRKSRGTMSISQLILWLLGFGIIVTLTFAASRRATGIRIIIIGDSISQGHEGDWTWRYRLWQWTHAQGVLVDFVGPYAGTRVCIYFFMFQLRYASYSRCSPRMNRLTSANKFSLEIKRVLLLFLPCKEPFRLQCSQQSPGMQIGLLLSLLLVPFIYSYHNAVPQFMAARKSVLRPTFNFQVTDMTISGGYAVGIDPRFDRSHWAAWGRQIDQDINVVTSIVTKYKPDILLVLLGYNDLAYINDAQGTLNSMQTFIQNARVSKPDISFAIGNVPQRTLLAGLDDLPTKIDQYNALLASAIPQWSTSTSTIELVKMRENYDCGSKYHLLSPCIHEQF
jgi:hypothetical protein